MRALTRPAARHVKGARRIAKPGTGGKREFPIVRKLLLSLLSMAVLGLVIVNAQRLYGYLDRQNIDYVVIQGQLEFVSENEVRRAIAAFVDESLLAVSLDELRRTLEAEPWIRQARIRKQWPDTLTVDVTEEIAIARWGGRRLLNQDGDIFEPRSVTGQSHLADLSGPAGSEQMVMEQYQAFNRILFPRGLRIASLSLSNRHAWSMILDNGIEIRIGSDKPMERIRRFAEVMTAVLPEDMTSVESVDLRYDSGIAVRQRQLTNEEVVSL